MQTDPTTRSQALFVVSDDSYCGTRSLIGCPGIDWAMGGGILKVRANYQLLPFCPINMQSKELLSLASSDSKAVVNAPILSCPHVTLSTEEG